MRNTCQNCGRWWTWDPRRTFIAGGNPAEIILGCPACPGKDPKNVATCSAGCGSMSMIVQTPGGGSRRTCPSCANCRSRESREARWEEWIKHFEILKGKRCGCNKCGRGLRA